MRKFRPIWEDGYSQYEHFQITISFKTFEAKIIKDVQFYFIENLLSDIGGQLGLFSGLSALTIVEFIFLIITLIYQLTPWSKKENKPKHEVNLNMRNEGFTKD